MGQNDRPGADIEDGTRRLDSFYFTFKKPTVPLEKLKEELEKLKAIL